MSEPVAVRLRIHGRVQGVGYRYWLSQAAEHVGVTGWVRNRRDGSVEAILNGSADAIDRLIVQAQSGPAMADVEKIDQEHVESSEHREFLCLPTL